ncbi:MAG: helix-turn-helix transcriptional regulator [Gallionellaceae bacterium]
MAKPKLDDLLNKANQLGERIKAARASMELTQVGLAKKASLSRSAVVHYEQGNAVPGGVELVKLAEALHLTPNYLLSGSDDYFASQTIDHALASDDMEVMVARNSICLMVLDREVRESISALLMTLVKAKLPKRKYKELIEGFGFVDKVIPQIKPGLIKLADKSADKLGLPPKGARANPKRKPTKN